TKETPMDLETSTRKILRGGRLTLAFVALIQNFLGPVTAAPKPADNNTATPIKHVIIIVGENRTFDHLFGAYKPKAGESVSNLLAKGIVKEDGTRGPNFGLALQNSADITGSPLFELSPSTGKAPYAVLPAPLNGGPTNVCTDNGICNYGEARSSE